MDQPKLVTLFDLLRDGCTPAQLATAIEKHGVSGWDRFGRFGTFKPTSDGAGSALDILADFQSAIIQSYTEAEKELENMGPDDPYPSPEYPLDLFAFSPGLKAIHMFGWLPDKLPPIDRTVQHPPPPTTKISPRSANETLNALGGLLLVLKDLNESDNLMKMPSEAQLINKCLTKFPRFPGISKNNLEKKFAAAKQQVKAEKPDGR